MGKRRGENASSEFRSSMRNLEKKDVNNEKYPPFFELHIIRHIALCLLIELQGDVEVAPELKAKQDQLWQLRKISGTHFSECARASAT